VAAGIGFQWAAAALPVMLYLAKPRRARPPVVAVEALDAI
jgi:hypothetical protein